MNLWIVYTGWQGNGAEGVLVDAVDDHAARLLAWEALNTQLRGDIALTRTSKPTAEHSARLANYEQHNETWRAEAIELPYVGEFG